MIRILPAPPTEIAVAEAYAGSLLPATARPSHRPEVALCMVSSIDGSTSLRGASGGLSHPTDRQVLAQLRAIADVIVVGAGTVRDEDYGRPKKHGQRIGIVSRTGALDLTLPLFSSGAAFLILPTDAPAVSVECVRAGTGEVDLTAAMALLPGEPRRVQLEGGPSLNGAFAAADLIDEVNLTVSPRIVGGGGARVTAGAPESQRAYELAQTCIDDGFLFTRYVRLRA